MLRWILLIGVPVCVCGCTGTEPLPKGSVFYSGVYFIGENVTEPRPSSSKYMKITGGGFIADNTTASYHLEIEMTPDAPQHFYVSAKFENPMDADHPFTEQASFATYQRTLSLTHGHVRGLKNASDYTVTVRLFNKEGDDQPFDTLTQKIRSYLDTTGDEVQIFRGVQRRQGS